MTKLRVKPSVGRFDARARLAAAALCAAALLSACGGGGGDGGSAESPSQVGRQSVSEKPAGREQAARFLTQATFGPTEADIDRVMAVGYGPWIDEQLGKPAASHRAYWDAANASIKAANANNGAWQDQVFESFWKQALSGDDQLRQRWAYALSQVFVISMADENVGNNPRAVAAWMDMLADKGLGNYRELLETVSRHPMMGQYLSHLRNQKADARSGRVPDENYAREVMQLFSIGLVELNADGTARSDGGKALETYTAADVAGLAKVFTGWSWACPEWPDNSCFYNGSANGASDPDRSFNAMLGYPQYHATDEKKFLGTTIAAQSQSDPQASLRVALDALAAHPNVGPFIGRQLIQRLVTSNPSPQYVAAVAAAFKTSGGDMKAMLRAMLMHPEARRASDAQGKLREPVLKLSAYLRAFGYTSDSGSFRVGNTDSPSNALGQTPMRSPSVFNFYRPGYVAPGTESAASRMAAPELQIAHETTAAGYVNYMRDNVSQGVGQWNSSTNRRDLQADFSAEVALADQPTALIDRINAKLMGGAMPEALKIEIQGAIEKMGIRALNKQGTNQKDIDYDKRNRVNAAIFLALVSPEFQVQK